MPLGREMVRVPVSALNGILAELMEIALQGPSTLPEVASVESFDPVKSREPTAEVVLDDVVLYEPKAGTVTIAEERLADASVVTGIPLEIARYLLAMHGNCHRAMHAALQPKYPGDSYLSIDKRVREHFADLLQFYLLFDSNYVRSLVPQATSEGNLPPESGKLLGGFKVLSRSQPADLRVDEKEFTVRPATWTLDYGLRLIKQGYAGYSVWHRATFGSEGH